MNIRRFQGWALLAPLPISLLSFVFGDAPWFGILSAIGTILFIFGVPAIQSVQPMGTPGLAGIILAELAAVIALGIHVMGGPEVSEMLILTSVLAGALGHIIVGWLTARGNVFPAWVGWAFLLHGLLNLSGYLALYDLGTFGSVLGTITYLLDVVATFGYGLRITQQQS